MTSSRYTLALALLVLTAVASAFQVSVPSHAKIGRMTSSARRMEEDVEPFFASTAEPKADDDVVVKDVTPARVTPPSTPAPVSASGGLPELPFSWVLGAYVVFAVADSFFHFTPEKSYIQTLSELVRGVDPSATVVHVPVPTESIAPVVTEIVNTATSLLDQ